MDEIETTYVEYSQVKSADLAKLVEFYNAHRFGRFLPHRLDQGIRPGKKSRGIPEDDTPNSVHFSPDESRMYIVGGTNDRVYQYDVGSPRTLNDITYASKSYSVSAQTTSPSCVRFKPDGTIMYVSSQAGVIYQYTLTAPWDLAGGVTYLTSSTILLTGSIGIPSWTGFDIVNNGATLFVAFSNVGGIERIGKFTLNTPWLISSANYQQVLDVTAAGDCQDIQVMEDGSSMLILSADSVRSRRMANPYDISLTTEETELDISSVMDTARGMYCSPDGTRLYAIAPAGAGTDDAVVQWYITKYVAA